MKLGIVGHAAEKFTDYTEELAWNVIDTAVKEMHPELVISGHSPMGGVDIWAEEVAAKRGVTLRLHKPRRYSWEGDRKPAGRLFETSAGVWVQMHAGYKDRNLAIARESDLVLCVVVARLPDNFKGMKFEGCYHCGTRNPEHVKSGGCRTAWKCAKHQWVIIEEPRA